MAIQGLRDTGNWAADERPKNWREGLLRLYPSGKMALTGLTSAMKSRSVDDPEFNWWDKQLQTRRVTLTADLTTSNTSITVASGAMAIKKGDVLYVEQTGEIVVLTADPVADTSITVQRGFAGTTAAAVTYNGAGVNPNLRVIGSAYEEGSLAPTGVAFDPTKRYNYTQIFRNTLEITRTAARTRLRTVDAVKEAKRECLELHGIDMEMAFWLGQRSEGTFNGKPRRTTGGVTSFIDSANIVNAETDYASGLTMEGLEEYLYQAFRWGSSEKLAIGGNRALMTLNQTVRKNSTFNIQSGLKEFGMNVTRFTTPFGELVFKSHPLFNQMTGGTTGGSPYYGMESWMYILDMDNFRYVYLRDSDTKYEPELQANGLDGMKSGYITEAGIEIHHPQTHFLIKSLNEAAADA